MNNILNSKLNVINIGAEMFADDLINQNVKTAQVNWKPLNYKKETLEALNKLDSYKDEIKKANEEVINIIKKSSPFLVGMDSAINVIPNMTKTTILHAGPPITFERMAGPVKGAVLGAVILEGFANTIEEAQKFVDGGNITFAPCNEFDTVGPMAGIVSASMPVHIIENETFGNKAFCTVNEGLGKVLRFGANSEEVINRLKWIRDSYMPIFKKFISIKGKIDLKNLITQGLQMGDECHNRNKASTSLLIREMIGTFTDMLIESNDNQEKQNIKDCINFINNNDHYFLNLAMPAAKCTLDACIVVKNSSIVITMARNGIDFGIRLAGMEKTQWFVDEAEIVNGLLFAGYSKDDCCRDLGDSAITETYGIGGFAMAAAPAIVNFVGGTVKDSIEYSKMMYTITTDKSQNYSLPALNFMGNPIGIDVISVIETGVLPIINTGIAHKEAGVGQVGAGITHPPMKCFEDAIIFLASKIGE